MKAILWIAFIYLIYCTLADIRLTSPIGLIKNFTEGKIKHGIANYGKTPYGTTMAGRVYYFKDYPYACTQLNNVSLFRESDPTNKDFTDIVLVNRGFCSFVKKTRNIQEAGGSLALIADNKKGRNPEEIIMIDDGSSEDIAIPTVIISYEDGLILKEEIEKIENEPSNPYHRKEFVILMVDFVLENPDDRVEYEIWYLSGNKKALDFIIKMQKYNKRLGKSALMTPHISLATCHSCTTKQIKERCIPSEGEYFCVPSGTTTMMYSVKDAIHQTLIELCVYETYKDENNGEKWWEYISLGYKCYTQSHQSECLKNALDEVGINKPKIEDCMNKRNETLRNEHEKFSSSEIFLNPAIIINQRVYRGTLDPEHIFKTICKGFNETPDVCYEDYDEETQKRPEKDNQIARGVIILLILALVVTNILLFYCYKIYESRRIKEEITEEINKRVSNYIAYEDTKENKPLST